jgi:hypothetical protein
LGMPTTSRSGSMAGSKLAGCGGLSLLDARFPGQAGAWEARLVPPTVTSHAPGSLWVD